MGTKLEHWKQEGLSLRFTFLLMCALSVSITVLLLYANYVAFHTFHELSVAADNYIELQADASSLLEASDYLTEQAQRYAVIGEREYLDNYINELPRVIACAISRGFKGILSDSWGFTFPISGFTRITFVSEQFDSGS